MFYAVLGIGILSGYFTEVILVFTIVFIHEMGHAFTAHFFKWRIVKIELLPFGGVAELKENGNRPLYQELLVIIAGPFQHVWMIALSFLLVGHVSFWGIAEHEIFVWHNIVILSFNLLPIWPLDGGRLLQLAYSLRYPFRKAQLVNLASSCICLCIITGFALYFFPFHLNLWVVLSFLFISNYLEWKQRHYTYMRFLIERMQGNMSRKMTSLYVAETMPVQEVLTLFQRGKCHTIHIKKSTKSLKEAEVLKAFYQDNKRLDPICTLL